MARKRYPPTDPREWLNRAGSNLALAKNDTVGRFLKTIASMRNRLPRKQSRPCSFIAVSPSPTFTI